VKTRFLLAATLCVMSPSVLVAADSVDLDVVHRIKDEAFQHSQVMDSAFQLTEVCGPRLTGSPGHRCAAEWAVAHLKEWGITDAKLEPWGEFGRGWSYSGISVSMTTPTRTPLNGVPMAWCAGTTAPVEGDVVLAPLFENPEDPAQYDLELLAAHIDEYVAKYRGTLGGKIVLLDRLRKFTPADEAPTKRLDDKALADLFEAPEPLIAPPLEWPLTKLPIDEDERRALYANTPREIMYDYGQRRKAVYAKVDAFLNQEGALAVLRVDSRGAGGHIFAEAAGSYEKGAVPPPPTIKLMPEQYNRLVRLVEKKVPTRVSVALDADFHDDPISGMNVVAEIPGQGKHANEVVMIGSHLDSWHGATGATDDGGPCAVMLEVMRILNTLDLPLDRTVRVALWGGEEQGLLGSRGYVMNHFGNPVTMALKPEHDRLSVYLNLDNGVGKIRGVYLQGNDMARPIFESWFAPFKDMGVKTVTIRNTGGTDHLYFDAVGLPGFEFLQDPLDYRSRTHHSNVDAYDHLEPADLMQAAAVVATCVYEAANRPEAFPRKPLPEPLPPKVEMASGDE